MAKRAGYGGLRSSKLRRMAHRHGGEGRERIEHHRVPTAPFPPPPRLPFLSMEIFDTSSLYNSI